MACVDDRIRLLRQPGPDGADDAVLGIEIDMFVNGIPIVAGDQAGNVAKLEPFHKRSLTFQDDFIISHFRADASSGGQNKKSKKTKKVLAF